MKNLELMGVQEMNAVEMREIDGGFPLFAACVFVGALIIGLIINGNL